MGPDLRGGARRDGSGVERHRRRESARRGREWCVGTAWRMTGRWGADGAGACGPVGGDHRQPHGHRLGYGEAPPAAGRGQGGGQGRDPGPGPGPRVGCITSPWGASRGARTPRRVSAARRRAPPRTCRAARRAACALPAAAPPAEIGGDRRRSAERHREQQRRKRHDESGGGGGGGGGGGRAANLWELRPSLARGLAGVLLDPLVQVARPRLPRGQVRLDAQEHAPLGLLSKLVPVGAQQQVPPEGGRHEWTVSPQPTRCAHAGGTRGEPGVVRPHPLRCSHLKLEKKTNGLAAAAAAAAPTPAAAVAAASGSGEGAKASVSTGSGMTRSTEAERPAAAKRSACHSVGTHTWNTRGGGRFQGSASTG